jgi:hypothetical protein
MKRRQQKRLRRTKRREELHKEHVQIRRRPRIQLIRKVEKAIMILKAERRRKTPNLKN